MLQIFRDTGSNSNPLHNKLVPDLKHIDSIPADYSRNEDYQISVEYIDAGHGILPDLKGFGLCRSRARSIPVRNESWPTISTSSIMTWPMPAANFWLRMEMGMWMWMRQRS
jgi:hypothetical protein